MLNRDEIQSLLPLGIELGQKRGVPACQGDLFDVLDRRLSSKFELKRSLRVLEIDAGNDWRSEWFQSLQKLAEGNLPGICRPLEFGQLGQSYIYLIFDHFPAVLADQIPQAGVADTSVAWSVFGQTVEGLAELHQTVGPHGDLRTENIFLDTPQLTASTRISIGHAELTRLPQWTHGALLCPGTRNIFPPEWNGQLGEPSETADVYALGLLAIELLAGTQARNNIHQDKNKKLSVLRNRGKLIQQMLKPARQRLKDGPAVRAQMKFLQRLEYSIKTVAAVLSVMATMGLIVVFGWWWTGNQTTVLDTGLREAQKELAAAQKVLNAVQGELATAIRSRDETQERVKILEGQLAKPLPKPTDVAQQVWAKNFRGRSTNDFAKIHELLTLDRETDRMIVQWRKRCEEAWASINHSFTKVQRKPDAPKTGRERAYDKLKKTPWDEQGKVDLVNSFWNDFFPADGNSRDPYEAEAEAFGKVPAKSWMKEELSRNLKLLDARRASWSRWLKSYPPELIQPWNKFTRSPWDETYRTDADAQLDALERAEDAWRNVIARKPPWAEFQAQLRTAVDAKNVDGRARKIVDTWIDQFNALSGPGKKASVAFLRGTSPSGSGTYRTCDVHIDGSLFAMDNEQGHDWDSEIAHTYSDPVYVSFPWKPDQSIQIKIYGERQSLRGGARPSYINKKYSGPVALWELSQERGITTGSHTIDLEVEECPGPPPKADLLP